MVEKLTSRRPIFIFNVMMRHAAIEGMRGSSADAEKYTAPKNVGAASPPQGTCVAGVRVAPRRPPATAGLEFMSFRRRAAGPRRAERGGEAGSTVAARERRPPTRRRDAGDSPARAVASPAATGRPFCPLSLASASPPGYYGRTTMSQGEKWNSSLIRDRFARPASSAPASARRWPRG